MRDKLAEAADYVRMTAIQLRNANAREWDLSNEITTARQQADQAKAEYDKALRELHRIAIGDPSSVAEERSA